MRPWNTDRPRNYFTDCADRPRPCPWVGCKHHLLLDVSLSTGAIKLNAASGPRRTIHLRKQSEAGADMFADDVVARLLRMRECCVVDVAIQNPDGLTLEDTGDILGVTRERVRQVESVSLNEVRVRYAVIGDDDV